MANLPPVTDFDNAVDWNAYIAYIDAVHAYLLGTFGATGTAAAVRTALDAAQASTQGTVVTKNTGTGAGDVPLNSNLGDIAPLNIGDGLLSSGGNVIARVGKGIVITSSEIRARLGTGLQFNAGDDSIEVASGTKRWQAFTTLGLTNWNVPSGITQLLVHVYAGGGGGRQSGKPGGAGAWVHGLLTLVAAEQLNITVGAGGTGGASPTAGGLTQVERDTGSVILAKVLGGQPGTPTVNGAGGTIDTGDGGSDGEAGQDTIGGRTYGPHGSTGGTAARTTAGKYGSGGWAGAGFAGAPGAVFIEW